MEAKSVAMLALLLLAFGTFLTSGVIIRTEINEDLRPFAFGGKVKTLMKSAKTFPDNGCFCLNDTCACCEHLDIPKVHINDTGCVELVYLPEDYGFSLLFLIDNVALINRTVSVRNPPPICYAVPKVSMANVCLQFYSLDIKNKEVTGCLRVTAELADIEIFKKNIGCFKFPMLWKEENPSSPLLTAKLTKVHKS